MAEWPFDPQGFRLTSPQSDLKKNQTLPQADVEEKNYFASTLAFSTYSYRETLFAELETLVEGRKTFDGLIIDLMQIGFSLPLEASS